MSLVVLPDGSEVESIISAKNRLRQYDFLEDSFQVWQGDHGFEVDHRFICELNFYATQYLSASPGQYRSFTQTNVTVGKHRPPDWKEVDKLMDALLERIKQYMASGDALETAAYALWRVNWIHPFVQGNGRTARAISYFCLCQKLNHWLPGQTIPERIRATRNEYCDLLHQTDASADGNGNAELGPLCEYLARLLTEQLAA